MFGRGSRRWRAVDALLRAYVRDPDGFWDGKMLRQAEKLRAKRSAVQDQRGWSADQVVDHVVDMLTRRAQHPPVPVYVTGLGSSGSHWLAGMLGELDGFVDVGEVYVSARMREELAGLDDEARRLVVDGIQLLHGLPACPDIEDRSTVNSAAGAYEIETYRDWDPRAVVVYLYRDPRDQVLSASFRKDEYRQFMAPTADDRDYLLNMCARNRVDRQRYLGTGLTADVEIAYEDLRSGAAPAVLRRVVAAAGRSAQDDAVARAVHAHDAATLRAAGATRGNLDLGGRARGWQRDAGPATRQLLHAELATTVQDLGYPLVECLPAVEQLGEPVRVEVAPQDATVVCAAGATITSDDLARLLDGPRVAIDLSGVSLPDDAADAIAMCPTLQVVGLLGVDLTAGVHDALRAAAPGVTLVGVGQ